MKTWCVHKRMRTKLCAPCIASRALRVRSSQYPQAFLTLHNPHRPFTFAPQPPLQPSPIGIPHGPTASLPFTPSSTSLQPSNTTPDPHQNDKILTNPHQHAWAGVANMGMGNPTTRAHGAWCCTARCAAALGQDPPCLTCKGLRRMLGYGQASVFGCLPLAVPIGLSPLLILTLCGSERVLVVSTEPPDDLSCLTTPGSAVPETGCCPCR